MTWVLVVHEHHGVRYFEATTDTQLAQACCRLLRERLEAGYYGLDCLTAEDVPCQLDDHVLAALPQCVQRAVKKHNRDVIGLATQLQQNSQFLADVTAVLASPIVLRSRRGALAWELLLSRKDAESEHVELYPLEHGSETHRPSFISEELHFRMEQEGWALFYSDGVPQVMRLDGRGILATDSQAIVLAREAGLAVTDEGLVDLTRSIVCERSLTLS